MTGMTTMKIDHELQLEELLDVCTSLLLHELDFSMVGDGGSWYQVGGISLTQVSKSKPTTFRLTVDVEHDEGKFVSKSDLEDELSLQIERMR